MRSLLALACCLALVEFAAADEKPAQEPKAVTSRIKRLEADVHRQQQSVVKELVHVESEHSKQIDALYEACVDDLTKLLETETKANRLENAIHIKSRIEVLDQLRKDNRLLPTVTVEDGGAKEAVASPLARLKGTTWKVLGDTYVFEAGSVKVEGASKRCVATGSREVVVFKSSSHVIVLQFFPGFEMAQAYTNGKVGSAKKLKP